MILCSPSMKVSWPLFNEREEKAMVISGSTSYETYDEH